MAIFQCWHLCFIAYKCGKRRDRRAIKETQRIGRKLLSYPHFIGTVHSFFDTYVSLPWLKSNGYEINIIDTELVHSLRWNKLPRNKRYYLEMQYKSETICEYRDNIGNLSELKMKKQMNFCYQLLRKLKKMDILHLGKCFYMLKKF